MTRKHFKAFADAISKITNDDERKNTADLVGGVCSDSNSRFNWSTWYSACGVER